MIGLKLEFGETFTASQISDELLRIAPMIEAGFTSGEMHPSGWWSVSS